jgi:hypothetical protein
MPTLEIDFLADFSEEALITELQRVAQHLGQKTLSRNDIDRHAKMSSAVVLKRFGSLRHALQAAGLTPIRFMKASEDELLDLLEELWVTCLARHGRRPERADMKAMGSPVSSDTIVRRFGSWKKALIATAERSERNKPTDVEVPAATTPVGHKARAERATLSVRKRFFVLKRDHYTCRICKATGVQLEVDHVVPLALGGSDALDNLQTLCFSCNRGKRDSLE